MAVPCYYHPYNGKLECVMFCLRLSVNVRMINKQTHRLTNMPLIRNYLLLFEGVGN